LEPVRYVPGAELYVSVSWKFFFSADFLAVFDRYEVVHGVMGLLHGARAEFSSHHRTEALQLLRLLHIPIRYMCTGTVLGTDDKWQSCGSRSVTFSAMRIQILLFSSVALNFQEINKNKVFSSVADRYLYLGSRVRTFPSRILDPGSRVRKILDPGFGSKLSIFIPKSCF
jgi:hypothetical protein